MPIDGLLAGVGNLLGQGITAASTARQNKLSRQWSQQMYDRQFQDNVRFWNMQNQYNDPSQQMARLKAAGLNPNLIYGSSSSGAAGQAGQIDTPNVQPVQFRTPEWGNVLSEGLNSLAQYYTLEQTKAQTDNLRADNTVKLEEAVLRAAQRENIQAGTARSKFDLDLDSELRQISADARRANLRKLQADTAMTISENERRSVSNVWSIREAAQRIVNMRTSRMKDQSEINRIKAATSDLWRSGQLKQLEIELREKGINPSDPVWMRVLGRIVEGAMNSSTVRGIGSSFWDGIKGMFRRKKSEPVGSGVSW